MAHQLHFVGRAERRLFAARVQATDLGWFDQHMRIQHLQWTHDLNIILPWSLILFPSFSSMPTLLKLQIIELFLMKNFSSCGIFSHFFLQCQLFWKCRLLNFSSCTIFSHFFLQCQLFWKCRLLNFSSWKTFLRVEFFHNFFFNANCFENADYWTFPHAQFFHIFLFNENSFENADYWTFLRVELFFTLFSSMRIFFWKGKLLHFLHENFLKSVVIRFRL